MGASCTKLQNKKHPRARPSPPPFAINEEGEPGPYDPKPIAEVPGEIEIRIIEPSEPSEHPEEEVEGSQRLESEEVQAANERSPSVAEEGTPVEGSFGEESKSDIHSVHSKSSQRSQRSQKKDSLFSFFTKKNPDKNLETKGAKTAAHPSRNKTIDDFAMTRDDKDFPTDGLEKIKVLTRDHLPLDILTRRTKILNNLKSKMSQLEKLELRHCKLNSFPVEFKSKVINELNFSDNLIPELPSQAFKSLPKLQVLNVSQNRIVGVPDSLSECPELHELYLGRNQITSLDQNMLMSLTNLTVIDVMHNRIDRLTFTLQSIPNVKELNLSMNSLKSVDDEFFEGSAECKLEVLKLSLNPLETISAGVMHINNLRRLDLRQTHIGDEHEVVIRIKERNKEQKDMVVKCLINQLVLYSEVRRSEISDESAPQSHNSHSVIPEQPSVPGTPPLNPSSPTLPLPTIEEQKIALEDERAAQNQIRPQEEEYDLPPKTSPLHNPLKELILQVGDNLHIILTVATIEKIVKQGLESRERGAAVVDLPLTSNYFMERIAKYPSAINVLAAFKYQIKDDPRRGLVLQPTSEFRSSRRSANRKSQPVYRADGEHSPDTTPRSGRDQESESVEELLALLLKFKVSVSKVVEKEFNVPDFKAYHRVAV